MDDITLRAYGDVCRDVTPPLRLFARYLRHADSHFAFERRHAIISLRHADISRAMQFFTFHAFFMMLPPFDTAVLLSPPSFTHYAFSRYFRLLFDC